MFRKIARKFKIGSVLLWLRKTRQVLKPNLTKKVYEFSPNQIKFRKYRSFHNNQRCFVIGNGPSLKTQDLDKLANEFTFAANKIYLLFPKTKWRPTYYNIEDELVARQNNDRINQLKGFKKFFRCEFKKILQQDSDVIWYRDDHQYSPFPQFSKNACAGMYWGSSVTYISMQLAYYMGFSKIYLLGVDFDFCSAPTKLANGSFLSGGEINHFSSDYRKAGEIWNQPNLDIQLKAYQYAEDFSRKNGFRFFNATRGGKLEVFERVDFDSLF